MRAMESAGFIQAICAEPPEDILTNLKTMLVSLLSDGNIRREMSEVGQRMVDGKGGLRVAQKICNLAY